MKIPERTIRKIGGNVIACDPKLSVVIPAYMSAGSISETLDSVFSQTHKDFEVIVVNDGSPDEADLEGALLPYIDDIVYISQRNGGAGSARNSGIQAARGDIVAFIDADDVWQPAYLSRQCEFIERHGLDMCYCDAELFGTPSVEGTTFMQTSPSVGEVSVAALLDLRCNVITSGTVVRRRVLERVGGFEHGRVLSEDFHLWVRLAASGARIGYQRDQLLKYRVTAEGLSGDEVSRVRRAIDVFGRLADSDALSDEHHAIIRRRIGGFEADLAVAEGKVALINGSYRESAAAFARASRLRPSAKLRTVSFLSRMAPGLLRRIYSSSSGVSDIHLNSAQTAVK